jgi:hypothetical protein
MLVEYPAARVIVVPSREPLRFEITKRFVDAQ